MQPRTADGPFLADGDVIGPDAVTIPTEIGPVLDQAQAMLGQMLFNGDQMQIGRAHV